MKDRINDLAKLLGLPTWLIKESVGIPLPECSVAYIDQAKRELVDADPDSEEERAAYERLRDLLDKELKGFKGYSLEKAREIYSIAKEFENPELEVEAHHRWNDLAGEEVEKAKNMKELLIAFDKTPKNGSSRRAALEKQSSFALSDFRKAQTKEDLVSACNKAPKESEAQRVIIKKIYELYFK